MRKLPAVALAAAVAASGVVALGAGSAAALNSPVNIRVEHRYADAQRVLEKYDVTPGVGKEITAADEIPGSADFDGNVDVDIDPVARTITLEVIGSGFCYADIVVLIESEEIVAVSTVSDNLMSDAPTSKVAYALDGLTTLAWYGQDQGDCNVLNTPGSTAVFSYSTLDKPTLRDVAVSGSTTAATATRTVAWLDAIGTAWPDYYTVVVKRGSTTVLTRNVEAWDNALAIGGSTLATAGSYTVTVTGTNAAGTGGGITEPFTVNATKPSAVRSLSVSGKTTATKRTISWLAPSFSGHTPITGYQVVIKKGTKTVLTKTQTAKSLTVSRSALKTGSFTVIVTAKNVKGYGPAASKAFTIK